MYLNAVEAFTQITATFSKLKVFYARTINILVCIVLITDLSKAVCL